MNSPFIVHDLGGPPDGAPVLLLHANGFHAFVFEPLASTLPEFRCIALDLPGHGDAAAAGPSGAAVGPMIEALASHIESAGLRGRCVCLGHSLGGALALASEAAHPGLFAALFVYEPVAGPAGDTAGSPARLAARDTLAGLARRRRGTFASPAEAHQRLRSKPPFSSFHPAALSAYIRHGLRPVVVRGGGGSSRPCGCSHGCPPPEGGTADGASQCAACKQQPQQQQQQQQQHELEDNHHHQQQQQQEGQQWALACTPATEAAWFMSVGEYVPFDPRRVRCPVMLAIGVAGGVGGGIHGQLALLAERLADLLPRALLRRYPQLTHFGPLEDPGAVGADAREFFLGVLDARAAAAGAGAAARPGSRL